jgi:hypothetical protein
MEDGSVRPLKWGPGEDPNQILKEKFPGAKAVAGCPESANALKKDPALQPYLPPPEPPKVPPIDKSSSQKDVIKWAEKYINWLDDKKKAKLLDELRMLFDAVNNTQVPETEDGSFTRDYCVKWSEAVLAAFKAAYIAKYGPKEQPLLKVETIAWETPWGLGLFNPFDESHLLGHQALKITLPNGAVFYVDKSLTWVFGLFGGGLGNDQRIFGSGDIPFRYRPLGYWQKNGAIGDYAVIVILWYLAYLGFAAFL